MYLKLIMYLNMLLKIAFPLIYATEPKNTYEIRQVSISFEIPFPMSSSFPHFSLLKDYLFLDFQRLDDGVFCSYADVPRFMPINLIHMLSIFP